MAMLRVSSYRKLFEDDSWSRNGGLSMRCAGQDRASVRSVGASVRSVGASPILRYQGVKICKPVCL